MLKEFFLCMLVGLMSVALTIFLGLFYVANDHVIIANVLVWTGVVVASYLLFIFWPCWKKKKVRFVDLLAFSSGYLGVIIVCLSRSKSIEECNYLSTISFIAELLAIVELVASSNRNIQTKIIKNVFPIQVLQKIENEPTDIKNSISKIASFYKVGDTFTIKEISLLLNSTRYYAKKVIEVGVKVEFFGNDLDDSRLYFIDLKNANE